MQNTFITIQIPVSLKKKAASQAKKSGYSLAHYVRIAIAESVTRKEVK